MFVQATFVMAYDFIPWSGILGLYGFIRSCNFFEYIFCWGDENCVITFSIQICKCWEWWMSARNRICIWIKGRILTEDFKDISLKKIFSFNIFYNSYQIYLGYGLALISQIYWLFLLKEKGEFYQIRSVSGFYFLGRKRIRVFSIPSGSETIVSAWGIMLLWRCMIFLGWLYIRAAVLLVLHLLRLLRAAQRVSRYHQRHLRGSQGQYRGEKVRLRVLEVSKVRRGKPGRFLVLYISHPLEIREVLTHPPAILLYTAKILALIILGGGGRRYSYVPQKIMNIFWPKPHC